MYIYIQSLNNKHINLKVVLQWPPFRFTDVMFLETDTRANECCICIFLLGDEQKFCRPSEIVERVGSPC